MSLFLALYLLLLAALAKGHFFLVCTHLNEADPANACNNQDNNPYHQNVKSGYKHNYDHPSTGPLCVGRNDGFGMDASPTIPQMKAGSTTILAWAADFHSIFQDPTIADDGGALGRFVYIFHSNTPSPDDSLFKTTPYAQMDFQACGNKIGDYGIPTSADPGHICQGNLTLSEDLQPGVHTFVWTWYFFTIGEQPQNPIFDYVTCFQIQITNDNPSPSISTTGQPPAATWSPVYHSPFAPMKGLIQTLDAQPAQWHRANGKAFPVLIGPATATPTTSTRAKSTATSSTPTSLLVKVLPASVASPLVSAAFSSSDNLSESGSLYVDDSYYNTLTALPSNSTNSNAAMPFIVDSSDASSPSHFCGSCFYVPVLLMVVGFWL